MYRRGTFSEILEELVYAYPWANSRLTRYMTLEYHLAELSQRGPSVDREATLRRALEQYERFITRIDEYELLSAGDKKLFEQYMANPSTFTLAPLNDAAARRDIKVRRFRDEKELKQKLEVGFIHDCIATGVQTDKI